MNRITSKNEVDFEDNIFTGVKIPSYGTGTWHWDIPWKVVTNSNRSISIGTFRQLATADNNGKAVITGGRSQESNAADPTSDLVSYHLLRFFESLCPAEREKREPLWE